MTSMEAVPVGLITWRAHDKELVGGEYRIRPVTTSRWEVLYQGAHQGHSESLELAMYDAEEPYREILRSQGMRRWGQLSLAALLAFGLLMGLGAPVHLWAFVALNIFAWVGLSALARFLAAATRNPDDPYRRRDPGEPRHWWWT